MNFNEYQKESRRFAVYPSHHGLVYPALGLVNEAGEVAGKIKKVLRGDKEYLDTDAIAAELGDVLWYLSQIATYCTLNLEDVAIKNIEKLEGRAQRGTIKGSGDVR